jgi:hypothetical protein
VGEPEPLGHLADRHGLAGSDAVDLVGQAVEHLEAGRVARRRPERVGARIRARNDVVGAAEPDLRDGGILPGIRLRALHAGVEREHTRPRDRILQSTPGRRRKGPDRQLAVQVHDLGSVSQDLVAATRVVIRRECTKPGLSVGSARPTWPRPIVRCSSADLYAHIYVHARCRCGTESLLRQTALHIMQARFEPPEPLTPQQLEALTRRAAVADTSVANSGVRGRFPAIAALVMLLLVGGTLAAAIGGLLPAGDRTSPGPNVGVVSGSPSSDGFAGTPNPPPSPTPARFPGTCRSCPRRPSRRRPVCRLTTARPRPHCGGQRRARPHCDRPHQRLGD